jgi:hypothetical protein
MLLIMPAHPIRLTTTSAPSFQMGVADLQMDFTGIEPDLPKAYIIAKVNNAARAVAAYYGRFPEFGVKPHFFLEILRHSAAAAKEKKRPP